MRRFARFVSICRSIEQPYLSRDETSRLAISRRRPKTRVWDITRQLSGADGEYLLGAGSGEEEWLRVFEGAFL